MNKLTQVLVYALLPSLSNEAVSQGVPGQKSGVQERQDRLLEP